MPLMWLLVVVTLMISFLFNAEQTDQERRSANADVSSAASGLLVYRNAVTNYVLSNPTFNGVVVDAQLSFPSWYVKAPNLGGYVAGGTSYSYYSGALPGLASELARRTESFNVGINQNGVLLSPNQANVGITLPVQIPNGSVVLIQ